MTASHGASQDGRTDFDFIIGRWNIHHRRLREWLKGSTSWEDFEGTAVDHKILAGWGSVSEVNMYRATGMAEAFSTRLFDPESGEWSIYYAGGTAEGAQGTYTLPMIGGFHQGRGAFYAHETFGGKHVLCRWLWSDITPTSCHWEQAFSVDGGNTWETNWVMDLSRQEK
ncbi:hypothetical protein [Ktedonobacter robiniae]|uniref:DUF1579 domain-containing protein n=1 Tax=Ktedonobacter robiniae TaxID=2778365 RepID=A0ABQ3UWU3_9CHLR|nr:hypothetical protein [Ktedonobacter robiniae]GHO56862.1 hypothetical protein KSB_53370 [Ktedonobacter robiniae]